MTKIIDETEITAYSYFKAFGFTDEDIQVLIVQGKKDLYKHLTHLEHLLGQDTFLLSEINDCLHALKGLFAQLGNHAVSEALNELKSNDKTEEKLVEISRILFDGEKGQALISKDI